MVATGGPIILHSAANSGGISGPERPDGAHGIAVARSRCSEHALQQTPGLAAPGSAERAVLELPEHVRGASVRCVNAVSFLPMSILCRPALPLCSGGAWCFGSLPSGWVGLVLMRIEAAARRRDGEWSRVDARALGSDELGP